MAYGLDADTAQKMCFDSALALGANPTADAVLKAVTKTLFLKDNGSSQALDTMFLLYSAFLVFLMQAGFAMVRHVGNAWSLFRCTWGHSTPLPANARCMLDVNSV